MNPLEREFGRKTYPCNSTARVVDAGRGTLTKPHGKFPTRNKMSSIKKKKINKKGLPCAEYLLFLNEIELSYCH